MSVLTNSQPKTITVHVPMRFRVHGGRKAVISDFPGAPGQGAVKLTPQAANAARELAFPPSHPRTHNALIKALARAHRWRRTIESGEYNSISELASAERINQSYACRLLRLTLLAPSVVTEILDGRCRSDLTVC